jgi:phage terminase large subunit GpA-like protein
MAAVRSGETDRIQSVLNTDFGELYRVGGEAPPIKAVLTRRHGYQQGQVPDGVNLLTAGVDVQQNRLVYVIRGWGKDYESWLIEYGELWGETDKPMVWQRLGGLLMQPLCDRALSLMAIDSGYQTPMVYQFCRQYPGTTLATKGHAYLDKPFYKAEIDVDAKGQSLKRGLSLWHFNTDQVKSWVHARMEWPVDQPGGWWLPEDISDDYCQQLVSEQRLVKPNGQVAWMKVKKDNHYFDAESLAYLAVRIISNGRPIVLEGQSSQPIRRVSRVRPIGLPGLYEINLW